jgi:beta-lactam-binding protein with PASTA domain
MQRFLRYLLLSLLLIFVAMVSALTSMRFAIHGRESSVPKLVGLTTAQAEQSARAVGLTIEQESKFYSQDVPEGKIVSQAPLDGTRVRRGWKVRVAVSLGPQRTEVPNLIGQSSRAAEINVKRRGMELASVASVQLYPPLAGAEEGQVISQSPEPNAGEVSAPKISVLTVESPGKRAYVMPNFVGKHLGEAEDQIADSGFELAAVKEQAAAAPTAQLNPVVAKKNMSAPANNPQAVITKQYPAAGQKIFQGDAITLEIAK